VEESETMDPLAQLIDAAAGPPADPTELGGTQPTHVITAVDALLIDILARLRSAVPAVVDGISEHYATPAELSALSVVCTLVAKALDDLAERSFDHHDPPRLTSPNPLILESRQAFNALVTAVATLPSWNDPIEPQTPPANTTPVHPTVHHSGLILPPGVF
jgi:hypothetical protein